MNKKLNIASSLCAWIHTNIRYTVINVRKITVKLIMSRKSYTNRKMHNFIARFTVKCVIYSKINCILSFTVKLTTK